MEKWVKIYLITEKKISTNNMKNKLLLLLLITVTFIANAQNVGIGTNIPRARLHVTDSNVVFSAPGESPVFAGNPPISGSGRRMMWYADKAAFRAGFVISTNWDKDSIGQSSTASGYDTKALGFASTAMGMYTTASNFFATAFGNFSTASGNSSTAMGNTTIALGPSSTAMGHYSQANSAYSIAMGESVTANSAFSTSFGRHNDPIVAFPSSGWLLTEPLLIVGNGEGQAARKNALVILKNGNMGIGGNAPRARLHVADSSVVFTASGIAPSIPGNIPVSGAGRRMMWYPDKSVFRAGYVTSTFWDKDSTGQYSTAFGYDSKAIGFGSTAMGRLTNASGAYATAMGYDTKAPGYYSTSMGYGTTASGLYSTAMGLNTIASGSASTSMGENSTATGVLSIAMGNTTQANAAYSIAIGESATANSWSSISLGRHNDPIVASPTTGWVLTEPLLIIGNGTGPENRNNALVISKNGNIGIGFNNPSVKLDVNGNIRCVALTQTSDGRLKKEITPLQKSLHKISQLQGFNYYWKDQEQDSSLQSGVMAQEVQKIFPQLVRTDSKGYLSVNYIGLIPFLIESIKELKKENEELRKIKDEVEELRKMILRKQ